MDTSFLDDAKGTYEIINPYKVRFTVETTSDPRLKDLAEVNKAVQAKVLSSERALEGKAWYEGEALIIDMVGEVNMEAFKA